MNYQHAYHAGGIADVFKHIVLIQLLLSFQKKETAFTYFETHAGKAMYDFALSPAQKTKEYEQGIASLWQQTEHLNPAIDTYLNLIRTYNPNNQLMHYPGSGTIASNYVREQDEIILCDLHPAAHQDLFNYFYHDKHVHVHKRDGYEAVVALSPPKTKRGLVFIDPPYEDQNEFSHLVSLMSKLRQRWMSGMYVIWFPIKRYETILRFYQQIGDLNFSNVLAAEFWTDTQAAEEVLQGSGLLFINPPWNFDQLLENALAPLIPALDLDNGKLSISWISKN